MGICCTNIINLGCFGRCENINTGLIATQAGLHTVNIEFNNSILKYELSLNVSDEIIIDKKLNENYLHKMKIKQPDGTILNNTCYFFETYITQAI